MINTQLHNELIEQEIQRKAYEAKKRVQEAKTQLLKERLKQALLIGGFLFIMLLLLILLYKLLPKTESCTKEFYNATITQTDKQKIQHHNKPSQDKKQSLFNGVEYIKKDNYIYKRVYKNGVLEDDIQLAPTIIESKQQKHENIPQFAILKKR